MEYELCKMHNLPKDRKCRSFLNGKILNFFFVCVKCKSQISDRAKKRRKNIRNHIARTKYQLIIEKNRLLEKEKISKLINELINSRN